MKKISVSYDRKYVCELTFDKHNGVRKQHKCLADTQRTGGIVTISFRRRASAASRLAGLLASRLSELFLPRLRSSWIMVFFTYILSMSLHEPPLEFNSPLRLFGSGGSPSMQAMPPAVPFVDLPFMASGCYRQDKRRVFISFLVRKFTDRTNTTYAQH